MKIPKKEDLLKKYTLIIWIIIFIIFIIWYSIWNKESTTNNVQQTEISNFLYDFNQTQTEWLKFWGQPVSEIPEDKWKPVIYKMSNLNTQRATLEKTLGKKDWESLKEILIVISAYDSQLGRDAILSLKYAKDHPYQVIMSPETLKTEEYLIASNLKNIVDEKHEDIQKYTVKTIESLGIKIEKLDDDRIVQIANETYKKELEARNTFLNFIFSELDKSSPN